MRTDTLSVSQVESVNQCRNNTEFKLLFAEVCVVGRQRTGARMAKKKREAGRPNKRKEQRSEHKDDGCLGCSKRTNLESLVESECCTLMS